MVMSRNSSTKQQRGAKVCYLLNSDAPDRETTSPLVVPGRLLLGNLTGPATEVAIELHADGGPFNIGATLTTFSVPGIPSGGAELRTLTPNSGIVLAPNTTYWLVFAVLAGTESLEWTYAEGNNSTGPGSFGSYGYSFNAGASWENFGVDDPYKMGIEVSQISGVPEPASVLLLLSGLGAALASGSRRRSA